MKIGAEAILAVIIAPLVVWFASFVLSSYQVAAEVSNIKEDIHEIKQDVKEIHSFLLNKEK
jgi:hypothetical protein